VDDLNALIAELTRNALTSAAPDELVVFEETAQEYFSDPQAALTASGSDSAVGFGLELAMITPAALAVGAAVVQAIASHLSGRLVQFGERGLISVARRVLRVEAKPAELTLTAAQARHVRQLAWEKARALGMPESQAQLLADSFVGAIAVGG
jgi:hypothetical protein